MDDASSQACITHIRAAARLCEEAGMLVHWAQLMTVADTMMADRELPVHDRD